MSDSRAIWYLATGPVRLVTVSVGLVLGRISDCFLLHSHITQSRSYGLALVGLALVSTDAAGLGLLCACLLYVHIAFCCFPFLLCFGFCILISFLF